MFKGQLVQPRLLVQWGDVELSVDINRPDYTALQGCSLNFQSSDNYPSCNLTFTGDVVGYELYRKCIDEFRDEPIIVSIGYPRGSWFSSQYYYAGATLGSGNTNEISVTAAARKKDFLSAFTTSLSIESTLEELPQKVQEAVSSSDNADLVAFEFTTLAKQVASQRNVNGVVGTNLTPGAIISNQLKGVGLKMDLSTLASVNYPTVVAHAPEVANAQQGVDQPKERPAATVLSLDKQSYGFIVGPGLIREATRGVNFSPGSGGANSKNTPASIAAPIKPEPRDTGNPEEKAVDSPEAPPGPASRSTADTVTEESNPDLGISLKDIREYQDKFTISTSFFMVPEVVGVKPRDFIFIPSLLGDYLEEWVIDTVQYNFNSGGCVVDIGGFRLDLAPGRRMVDAETYNKFLDITKGLKTIEDWEKYYWRF